MATQVKHLPKPITMVSQHPKQTNSLSTVAASLYPQQVTVEKKVDNAWVEVHLATVSTISPPSAKPVLYIPPSGLRRLANEEREIVEPLYPSVFETTDSDAGESPPMSPSGSPTSTQPMAARPQNAVNKDVRGDPFSTNKVTDNFEVNDRYQGLPDAPMQRSERCRGRSRTEIAETTKRTTKRPSKPKRQRAIKPPKYQVATSVPPPLLRLQPKQRTVGFDVNPEDVLELRKTMGYQSELCPEPVNSPVISTHMQFSPQLDVCLLQEKLYTVLYPGSPSGSDTSFEVTTPSSSYNILGPAPIRRTSSASSILTGLGLNLYGSAISNHFHLPLEPLESLTQRKRSVGERLASYPSAERIEEFRSMTRTPGCIARYEPIHPVDKSGIRPKPIREYIEEQTRNRNAKNLVRSHLEKSCLERRMLEESDRATLSTKLGSSWTSQADTCASEN